MENEKSGFEGWAIVELMGRNVIAGYVSEQVIAGAALLRVDVPATERQSSYTKFFGGTSIYAITPTTEEIAKRAAERLNIRPVSEWVVPTPTSRQLVDTTTDDDYDDNDDNDNGDFDGPSF